MPTHEAEFGQAEESETSIMDSFGQRLRAQFDEVAIERRPYEDQWLADLRQYQGIYSPEEAAKISKNKSKAFIRKTRVKVRTMDSRVMEMMFPAGSDKNWKMDATPMPDPDPAMVEQARQRIAEGGQDQEITEEILKRAIDESVKASALQMSKTVEDQLVEGKYTEVIADVTHSGHLYGTGFLKGPMMELRPRTKWQAVQDPNTGQFDFQVAEGEELKPFFEYVPIWNMYLDLSEHDPDHMAFTYQRHIMAKHDLRRLAKRPDFDSERIFRYMKENPTGDANWMYHEEQIKSINAKLDVVRDRRMKYELLEFWGYVDAHDLHQCGCEGLEDEDGGFDEEKEGVEFWANIWILGNKVVKAVLNPSDVKFDMYHMYRFEKDDTSAYGVSVGSIIADKQKLLNAAYRAALDNAAITAGPQFEINQDLLADGEDPTDIRPFKEWIRKGRGNEARAPAIRVYNIDSHVPELKGLAETFERLLDETSSIPSYQHGEADKGVGRTVGGLSMLMGAANITVKDVVRNFDSLTRSFIIALYHWNMQFNDDRTIRGDFNVRVTGAASLVAKELLAQNLIAFAGMTNNPEDEMYVKRGDLWRAVAAVTDLPQDLVRTDEEVAQYMEALMERAAQEKEANAATEDAKHAQKLAEIAAKGEADGTARAMGVEAEARAKATYRPLGPDLEEEPEDNDGDESNGGT